MSEKPILFSGEMVRAILAGRKTQTRRIVKPQPDDFCTESKTCWREGRLDEDGDWVWWLGKFPTAVAKNKYGKPGGKLWVKETFSAHGAFGCDGRIAYRADMTSGKHPSGLAWKPSIFMPRKASRITLEIEAVRVERLQDISPEDCRAEGQPRDNNDIGVRYGYGQLWESINGKGSWEANPWVWCLTFKQVF